MAAIKNTRRQTRTNETTHPHTRTHKYKEIKYNQSSHIVIYYHVGWQWRHSVYNIKRRRVGGIYSTAVYCRKRTVCLQTVVSGILHQSKCTVWE